MVQSLIDNLEMGRFPVLRKLMLSVANPVESPTALELEEAVESPTVLDLEEVVEKLNIQGLCSSAGVDLRVDPGPREPNVGRWW
jgi:hypothetical protein